jgi:TolB-like protein/Flp pilus assembly protein TadD
MEAPATDAVADALQRLLASPQFAGSPRAARFLRFVVESALAGRGDGLKEYVLGIEVFDRAESFNPRIDTIVRVEAVKLRKRIQQYYRGPGRKDPVLIEVPKGTYVPQFRLRTSRTRSGPLSRNHAKPISVAVLPFANLSNDPEQEYWSDGLTDELTSALSRIGRVRTVSRSSASAFKNKPIDIRQTGQLLQADAIVEGSVRMQSGRVRVTAQLTQVSSGLHLWSGTMEREAHDAWAVQKEIARAVVAAVKPELTPEERQASADTHTPHPDAFELYLKARYASDHMQEASQRRAVEMFQSVIGRDPFYSLPLVGLARCYLNLTALNLMPPSEVVPHAREALGQALALDPNLPEAHGLMANTIARHEWDWPRAEQHFLRALELAPHSAVVHHEFSIACLVPQGRFEQALAENRRARELEPLSPTFVRGYTGLLIHARQFGEAERECRRLIAEGRDPAYFRNQLGLVLFGQRRFEGACAELKAAVAGGPNPEVSQVNVAIVQAILGQRAAAEELLEHLQEQAAVRYVPATSLAFLNGALGREEEALAALEQACLNREYSLVSAKVFFLFDSFRAHPRFQALLRELHLA